MNGVDQRNDDGRGRWLCWRAALVTSALVGASEKIEIHKDLCSTTSCGTRTSE